MITIHAEKGEELSQIEATARMFESVAAMVRRGQLNGATLTLMDNHGVLDYRYVRFNCDRLQLLGMVAVMHDLLMTEIHDAEMVADMDSIDIQSVDETTH